MASSAAKLSLSSARTPTVTPDVPGQYRIRLTATGAGGAESVSEVGLYAEWPATATVSRGGTVCAGMEAQLRVDLTGAGPWSVTWSDAKVQAGVMASPAVRTAIPATTRTYTVTSVTDAIGPGTAISEAFVTVQGMAPSVMITAPTSVRPGQTDLPASVPDAGPGATYEWAVTNGAITAGTGTRAITFSVGPAEESLVSVTVTAGACTASGTATLWVLKPELAGEPMVDTVAGSGRPLPGDGELAVEANLVLPTFPATDNAGNVYFSDLGLDLVLKIDPLGRLWRVAGSGRHEDSPDVGRPEEAGWRFPCAIAIGRDGSLYIGDGEG